MSVLVLILLRLWLGSAQDELITQKRVATQKAMREKGAAFKLKHKEKLARIARAAALAEENADVMALEKEKIVEEKHRYEFSN